MVCVCQLGMHMMYGINCLWTAEGTVFAITGDLGKKVNKYSLMWCELLPLNHFFIFMSFFLPF